MMKPYVDKFCIFMVSIPHFTSLAHQNLQLSPDVWIILVKSSVISCPESDKVNAILANVKRHDYLTLFLFERLSNSSNNSQQFAFPPEIIWTRYLNPENNLRLHVYFSEGEEFDLKSWLIGAQLNIIYLHQSLLENYRRSFNVLMETDVATNILVATCRLDKNSENKIMCFKTSSSTQHDTILLQIGCVHHKK